MSLCAACGGLAQRPGSSTGISSAQKAAFSCLLDELPGWVYPAIPWTGVGGQGAELCNLESLAWHLSKVTGSASRILLAVG